MKEKIKKIRELAGVGVIDIKKALEEVNGDEKKAIELLRKKGLEKADKKRDRETKEGIIGFYVHSTGKIVSWVKVYCETDFVAKNEEFQKLAKELAMQIAAMSPMTVKPEDISEEVIKEQMDSWEKEAEGKPEKVAKKITEGKEAKFRKEHSLMGQAFIKNQDITVGDHTKGIIAKIGENIQVGGFGREEL